MKQLSLTHGYSVPSLCRIVGFTKQAYYKHSLSIEETSARNEILLQAILEIRAEMPSLAGDKVHRLLKKRLPAELVPGRDATYALMRTHGLIRPRKSLRIRTTFTVYRLEYHDLIKGLSIERPNQAWVADITYIRLSTGAFIYLALVTDYYSRKIIGWDLSASLSLDGALAALKMALLTLPSGIIPIHHSDRGCQYYSKVYTGLLKDRDIPISMYTDGDPRNNAIAERINGTVKNEMLEGYSFGSLEEALAVLPERIRIYNMVRPHRSLDFLTPEEAYHMSGPIKRRWNTYYKTEGNMKKIMNEDIVDMNEKV